jgi:hypothetical protein
VSILQQSRLDCWSYLLACSVLAPSMWSSTVEMIMVWRTTGALTLAVTTVVMAEVVLVLPPSRRILKQAEYRLPTPT